MSTNTKGKKRALQVTKNLLGKNEKIQKRMVPGREGKGSRDQCCKMRTGEGELMMGRSWGGRNRSLIFVAKR